MGNKTLRRKISLFILVPLILGTFVTAVVSWLPIYLQYSYWIDDVIDDMINDQGKVLMEVSLHIASLTAGVVQIPSNYVMLVTDLIQDYYENFYSVRENFNGTSNYVNALQLLQSGENQTLMNTSMWYVSPTECTVDKLNKETASNLLDSSVFDMFLRPVMTPFTQNRLLQYFHAFNDTGLLYLYPALPLKFLQDYPEKNSCPYKSGEYDPRCTHFYSAVVNTSDHFLVVIPDPYMNLRNNTLTQTTCKGLWSGGSLTLVACVDFEINDVIEIVRGMDSSYAFALYTDESVFYHPKMSQTSYSSILELELVNSTSDEVQKFNETIIPLFATGVKTLSNYTKEGGKTMLIAITPVYVMLTNSQLFIHQFSVGVVMEDRHLRESFDHLKTESYEILIIEVAIFFGVMTVIVLAGWL